MKRLVCALSVLTVFLYFSKLTFSAEHPGEHPGTPAKEHPAEKAKEHPGEHPGKKEVLSSDEIIKGIKGHIEKVTKKNKGVLPVTDVEESEGKKEKKELKLKLVKVHEDKVSHIEKKNAYFACSDFTTEDGKTSYDVDFWMKKGKDGKLTVSKTVIHKKDGKPRFTYKDDETVQVK